MGCATSELKKRQQNKLSLKYLQQEEKKNQSGVIPENRLLFCGSTFRGMRPKNQDEFFCKVYPQSNISFFGVFDGHYGGQVAKFVRNYFPQYLLLNQNFSVGKYSEALVEVFAQIDDFMASEEGQQILLRYKFEKNKFHGISTGRMVFGGSTALIGLIVNKKVYIANSGDCKAIAVNKERIVFESVAHRCDNECQKSRIQSNGGRILRGRVQGNLNVTRGFGDFALKNYQGLTKNIIIVQPQIYEIDLSNFEYLFLLSDGVWEGKQSKMLWESFKEIEEKKIDKTKASPSNDLALEYVKVLEELFAQIQLKREKSLRGTDNMTCIMLKLFHQSETHSNSSL